MSSRTNLKQMGALEVVVYLAAIVVVIGSVLRGWNFNLLIALLMVIVLCAIFRDVSALSRLNSLNDQAQSSKIEIALQKSPL